ncbi:hypothetical protein BD410DRAFT_509110 [Rickenella mellea]|uniref:F-box domain-containing protein n=1 Tax=Rickenella mellea TaxID=50990 RepID=A0A4Y7PTB0_9AGAM|nr:hypothetical protein BD410DRAFT_509110 [Rickenella mellea]
MVPPLPDETWSNILGFLQKSGPDSCRDFAHRDLVLATHVCRFWREIALADPSLWVYISVSSSHHNHVESFLARSKTASLAIQVQFNGRTPYRHRPGQFSTALAAVTRHRNQIRSLSLIIQPTNDDTELEALFSWIGPNGGGFTTPPFLEALVLSSQHVSRRFPHRILLAPLPSTLKILDISDFTFPLDKVPPDQLEELYLRCPLRADGNPTARIFEILRRSPGLRIAHLNLSKMGHGDVLASEVVIPLPQLQRLVLEFSSSYSSMTRDFVEMLDIPADTCCDFTIRADYYTPSMILQPPIPQKLALTLRATEIVLSLSGQYLVISFDTFHSINSIKRGQTKIYFTTLLSIPHQKFKGYVIAILVRVLEVMPWSHPSSLIIDISPFSGDGPSSEKWLRVLQRLPTLENIEVRLTSEEGEVSQSLAASPLLDALTAAQPHEPCCPALRRLVFLDMEVGDFRDVQRAARACVQSREELGLQSIDVCFRR